ncbi:MAG TPA: CapA family protein [Candidatus Paceibacterota bacterium]|nr:CapA family protein [Candidatus Paceibacterota bacterium]
MVFRSKNSLNKRGKIPLALILFAFIAILFAFYTVSFSTFRNDTMRDEQIPPTPSPAPASPVTMVFVGDIMLDRGVRASVVKNLGGDYGKLFEHTGYLADADIAFANLEGPVGTTGTRSGSKFSFLMDPAGLTAVAGAGFDVVSFANNHIGDYSRSAFLQSLDHLKENNILYAGAGEDERDASTPRIITVRGMRIGFLAASDVGPPWMKATANDPGILLADDPNLPQIIADAKAQVDILVMSFHFGIEYSLVTERQKTLAHMAIDSGADIVVGAHPHVMQAVETYHDKPIFYGLGNFIFDQYFSPHTLEGMVAEVSIDPTTDAITATEEVSQQDKYFVPQPLAPFDDSMLIAKPFTP